MTLGLFASLALLLLHARLYAFLTDDSFISFRYSRNLAHGFGLVFNPGLERVEGYSNFLWVLILAGLDALGIAPERAANPLSLAATVALWGLVVAFALRRRPGPGREWLVLVPAFGLALTRSVAVWATSGLETRWFELFAVAGLLRLVVEAEALEQGNLTRPLAGWLLALATLTRPDGLLISGCAFVTAGAYLWVRRRAALPGYVRGLLPFAVLVAGHFAFRRIYYGDWLPNTYYAKVGGHFWWSSGGRYLAAFALEYSVVLWLPLLIAGVRHGLARRVPLFSLVAGAVLLPHALYVAAIGGDHFEYRPLDLVFPLAFLLMYEGAQRWASGRAASAATSVYLGVVALGLTLVPWESHRQFSRVYESAFPGGQVGVTVEARDFLSPDRDALLRLPGLREVATVHRDLTRRLTRNFVAIRQEEHRMFLATVVPEGQRLARLRESGLLPADTYIALDCIGAIPYYSDLRFLDRLGLTDAHVAHSPAVRDTMMAHAHSATMDYARARGVDLWAVDPVHLLLPLTSTGLIVALADGLLGHESGFGMDAGAEGYVICALPRGLEATRARLPGARIHSFGDTSFVREVLERCTHACRDTLAANPGNLQAARNLGYVLIMAMDFREARDLYRVMTRRCPDLIEGYEHLSLCDLALGRVEEGRQSGLRAIELAQQQGDTAAVERVRELLRSVSAATPR